MAFRVSGLALALPRWDLNRTCDGTTKKNSSCYAALLLSFNQQCDIWVSPMEDSPSYGRKRENDQPSKVSMGRWQSSLANVMQLLYLWMAVYVYITRYMSISMWICIIICYIYIDMYIHTYIHTYIYIYDIYTKYEQQISCEIVYAWCSLIATDFACRDPTPTSYTSISLW